MDVGAVLEPGFPNAGGETFGEVVAKAAIQHVGAPPGGFVIGAADAIRPCPFERFLIAGTVADDLGKRFVIHAEELAGPEIHAGAEVAVVVGMESAILGKADLVAEAGKIDDAVGFEARAAGNRICHAGNSNRERAGSNADFFPVSGLVRGFAFTARSGRVARMQMIGQVVLWGICGWMAAGPVWGQGRSRSSDLHTVAAPSPPRLAMKRVFQGEAKFQALVAKAERDGWRKLPLGMRTMMVAREMVGTPYVNFTLEVDDRIESPVVNFEGMDCWTYYENALAFARMLRYKPGPYRPGDMLHMVELERYRDGRCTGSYLSRMHHLEEVFFDNERRGLARNITARLPNAQRLRREIREMTVQWKSYRYLRSNPRLVPEMGRIEARVSDLPVWHLPKDEVRAAEKYLDNGDICAITTHWKFGYTSHVGLIMRLKGRAYFCHATSDRDKGRMTIIDRPITDYLRGNPKHAGIIVCRPLDLPPSRMWASSAASR